MPQTKPFEPVATLCLLVQVIIPEQCLLNPSPEAAVVGGNVLTSQRVTDVVLKAFGAAAASQVGPMASSCLLYVEMDKLQEQSQKPPASCMLVFLHLVVPSSRLLWLGLM